MIDKNLYNKVANDLLLEVKPVKLRKQIIPKIFELLDDEYQRGFSDGCDYETKIEDLAARNENLQAQLLDLQAKYGQLLESNTQKKKAKKVADPLIAGQLTIFDFIGEE